MAGSKLMWRDGVGGSAGKKSWELGRQTVKGVGHHPSTIEGQLLFGG